MADQSAQYTEEAVGGGHPTKARVIDRLPLIALNPDGTLKGFADTGTADAMAIAIDPAIDAYTDRQLFIVKKGASANTGACTLKVNALPPVSVKMPDGSDPAAGVLPGEGSFLVMYSSTGAKFVLVGGAGNSGGVVYESTQATTSGTSVTFTGIPPTARRVEIIFAGVSTTGVDHLKVQGGPSGGLDITGYLSMGKYDDGSSDAFGNTTDSFVIMSSSSGGSALIRSGMMVLSLLESNQWSEFHVMKLSISNMSLGGGDVTFSGALSQLKIFPAGSDSFDAGKITVRAWA